VVAGAELGWKNSVRPRQTRITGPQQRAVSEFPVPEEQLLWYLYLGVPGIFVMAAVAWVASKITS
jgi:hypothetical protein